MPFRVEFSTSLGCVEYVFAERCSERDVHEATSRGIELGKAHDTHRYLIDAREMDYTGTIVALLDLPARQYEAQGMSRSSRIALVLPTAPGTRADAKFYETASANRGWNVKCFETREEALAWLGGQNT